MKEAWTTTKLIAIGAIAVIRFLLKVLFYTTALTASGSVFSGLTILIIGPFFRVFTALIINQFGAVTTFSILSFLIELPLPVMWPFLVNLIYHPIAGLTTDVLYLALGRNKKLFSFMGGFTSNAMDMIITISLFFTVGFFGAESVPEFLTTPMWIIAITFLCSILGGFSGYLAFLAHERLKDTGVVKRIQS